MANIKLTDLIDETIAIPHLFTEDPLADPYACLGFIRNPDGSVTRQVEFPTLPASSIPTNSSLVVTKDVTINKEKRTWARIFLPKIALLDSSSEITKLPLIVDFHGGGFVSFSSASACYKNFYPTLAAEIPAVIVSVDYRRAPEHRLPAAYEDGVEALHWIKGTENEGWLTKYADLSNCFLMGSSAGGNIAYNLGLRVCSSVDHLLPLSIKGLILLQPFFGGTQRTPSELKEYEILPTSIPDVCWEMSLPIGADHDHEYSNPKVGMKKHLLEQIKLLGWKILVTGCDGDHLIDRQADFAGVLQEKGLQVKGIFEEGGYHGDYTMELPKAKALSQLVRQVMICN